MGLALLLLPLHAMSHHPRQLRIEDFDYPLPEERIARFPLEERDASKLLIYQQGEIRESIYRHIADEIPEGSMMVFNDTKVVQARLQFTTAKGQPIEIFCLEPGPDYPDLSVAMAQTGSVVWECLVGGNRKWKEHQLMHTFFTPGSGCEAVDVTVERVAVLQGTFLVRLSWQPANLSFAEMLDAAGITPLPPYLKRAADVLDKDRYQTVYARHDGSVAAPTAGLHFTDRVLASLQEKGIRQSFVTLHVGAGTFKPVQTDMVGDHDMHFEFMHVAVPVIRQLAAAAKIVVVGTTSLRTVESLYWLGCKVMLWPDLPMEQLLVEQWDPYDLPGERPEATTALLALADFLEKRGVAQLITKTQLMIAPGYTLRVADGLVTNFHQPKSTLILLVSAIVGDHWRRIYAYALANDFRFLSYGDGSLLWR